MHRLRQECINQTRFAQGFGYIARSHLPQVDAILGGVRIWSVDKSFTRVEGHHLREKELAEDAGSVAAEYRISVLKVRSLNQVRSWKLKFSWLSSLLSGSMSNDS